ncbi:MAG: threonine/serine exporter family protein [Clostridia bacterium]|nr:threonine/serine exporter family protein [Clostridia bacterium]
MQTFHDHTQLTDQKIRLICMAAQIVLENGGETYRVEETATRMANGLGLEDVNVVAFPTSIFVNVGGRSSLRRITHRGTNTARLARVNDVSRRVERGELTLEEARAKLDAIAADPGWSQPLMILAYGVSAASFSLVFGGNLGSFFVALIVGMLMQVIQPLFTHMAMGTLLFNFCGGFLTALLSQATSQVVAYGDVNATIIGGIMPLLTGLLMTTAVRDTMYGDLISGIARAVEALLLAGCVALGVFVGLKTAVMLGGMPL